MHVGHLMVGTTPFPHDWADVAGRFASVTRFGFESDLPGVLAVRRLKLKPQRVFHALNDATCTVQLLRSLRVAGERMGEAVELLHGHFYPSARNLTGAAKVMGIPVIVTEHSSSMTGRAAPHKQIGKAALARARRVYERASVVLAVSSYLAECILQRTGVQPLVVPNPVDVDLFLPSTPPATGIHVVFVGRLEADKQPELLLRGVARARQEVKIQLTIVGDGPDRAKVVALARDLGLEGSVWFKLQVARGEVARIVQSAHVGVSTSLVETFGLAAAECCAAGVPMVAPDQPPFDEVLPRAGRLLYTPGSAVALADSLVEAAGRPWDRRAIRQSIVDRFAPAVIAKRLEEVYNCAM